ncbi:hypothetical protein GCM10009060_11430 [Halorubrum trapanicum]
METSTWRIRTATPDSRTDLLERAAADARERDCGELRLDVDNERATAFYERWGFEPYRRQMTLSVSDV